MEENSYPPDMEVDFIELHAQCAPYTLLSIPRMYAIYKGIEYIEKNLIPGSIVECGVWRGGSSMMISLSLQHFGQTARNICLFDTYAGMSEPISIDVSYEGEIACDHWRRDQLHDVNQWCYAALDEVNANIGQTRYPQEYIRFIKGDVIDTIPDAAPDQIAFLHLDTDWYESTHHELTHLFPRLSPKGVLIIDDYGHWKGAREAVHQYFREQAKFPFLFRTDYTGRIMINV